MKKLLTCLVVLVMMVQSAPFAIASGERVTFTEFRYTDSEGVGIKEPESGLVYTEVVANYSGSEPQNVMLVVMLCDKETGKIKAIDSDSAELSDSNTSEPLKAGVTVNDIANEDYKYFLWDGVSTHTPLDNAEPAAPANITDVVNKPNEIELSWDASYDDFDDVAYYNLYNGDMLLSTGSDATAFTEKNLDKNTQQNYSVEAVDGEGLVSAKKEFSVKTANVFNVKMSTTDPDSITGVTEDGMYLWVEVQREVTGNGTGYAQSYGCTGATTAGGRECRETILAPASTTEKPGRFTLRVEPGMLNTEDSNLTIDITYFDDSTDKVLFEYTSSTTSNGSAYFVKTGTNLWKTATINVTNANFEKHMDSGTGYGNFRFRQVNSENKDVLGLKISDVAVAKTSDYSGNVAGIRVTDVPELKDVIFYMDQAEAVTHDGVNCIEIESGETIDIDITDSRLQNVGQVAVEIEYFDEGTGNLVAAYKNSGSSVSEKTAALTDSGEWKKAKLDISDAAFAIGGGVSTDDLVISSTTGEALKIKSIRIYDAR